MMAHIEMKALEKFPIEKLSYDLKLELLENMDPGDVVELVNVNQGFRSIVVREPWRILGKHVDVVLINTRYNALDTIEYKKFNSRIFMHNNHRISLWPFGASFPKLKGVPKDYSNLFSRIRSCRELKLQLGSKNQGEEEAQLLTKLLTNLDSMSELTIVIDFAETNIEEYLRILNLNHINKATLKTRFSEKNEQMLEFLSNFVETSLNHCKSIEIFDDSLPISFWYEPLSKIWTEIVLITVTPQSWRFRNLERDFEELIHRIVTKGIPSSNPEATILLWDPSLSKRANNSITSLLSRTPGIRQIADKDRGEVGEILEKLIVDELIPERNSVGVDQFEKFLQDGVYFTRPIDSNRKCIYVSEAYKYHFFAKYVTIG